MIRSRPAPASSAKAANSASKNGFETPLETHQKHSPVAGDTKANDVEPLEAMMAGSDRAHADRRLRRGLRPVSGRADVRRSRRLRRRRPDGLRLPRRRSLRVFFEPVLLGFRRSLRVARTRLLDRPTNRFERFPASLWGKPLQAQFVRHPARDLAARPTPAVGRSLVETDAKTLQQLRLQHGRFAAIVPAQIAKRRRPVGVVAFQELFDPPPPKRGDRGDFPGRMSLR